MLTRSFIRAAAAAILIISGVAAAQAQATRTWVSGVGDDANPCSRTAPCKTFAGSISKTAAGGEINVLDPGGFGGLTITKSITVISHGNIAGVLVAGTNGFTINAAATDRVVIDGLDFEGLGTGFAGIKILSAGSVVIKDTVMRNFRGTPGNCIDVVSATNPVDVYIDNVTLSGCLGGVRVLANVGNNRVTISDSEIVENVNFGVTADGTAARVAIGSSVLRGSPNDIAAANSGTIVSFGNNIITSGTPTLVQPLK